MLEFVRLISAIFISWQKRTHIDKDVKHGTKNGWGRNDYDML